jgi:phage terminase large subunit GpA-like protein
MEYLKNIEKVIQNLNQTWTPPKNLKISDWADHYRKLSPESSAEAGQWRTDRAEYQREIMDSLMILIYKE